MADKLAKKKSNHLAQDGQVMIRLLEQDVLDEALVVTFQSVRGRPPPGQGQETRTMHALTVTREVRPTCGIA